MNDMIISVLVYLGVVLIAIVMLICIYYYINMDRYTVGKVIDKYMNGVANKKHHIVIIDERKKRKYIDLTVRKTQYDKMKVKQVLHIYYSIFRRVRLFVIKKNS